jgi:hypothetical protein
MTDLGRIAHEAYEEAAAQSGWETNPASRVPWKDVPVENRAATTAAANAVARAERAAVAAWMRDFGNPTAPALPLVADAIEAGEHLRGNDE